MGVIKSKEVKVYRDSLYCEECGEEMKFTGRTCLSHPPKYPHICPKCGKSIFMREKYPTIRYEEI
jgi:ribosomal protein S27AE